MTKLLWDEYGQRLYEAGLDRGVLYLADNRGVVWNGLVSVEEDTGGDTTSPFFFDGVKHVNAAQIGDFQAILTAFTYPDEFLEYEGTHTVNDGFYADGQVPKSFGLSFRSKIGNDIEGLEHGYKLHLIYNVTAVPSTISHETIAGQTQPQNFSWELGAVPVPIQNHRPTAHVIIDSRFMPSDIMTEIENMLYGVDGSPSEHIDYDGGTPGSTDLEELDGGTPGSIDLPLDEGSSENREPRLPPIFELIDLVTLWDPRIIVPNIDGIADLVPGSGGDFTQTNTPGVYTSLPGNRLVESSLPGFYELPA